MGQARTLLLLLAMLFSGCVQEGDGRSGRGGDADDADHADDDDDGRHGDPGRGDDEGPRGSSTSTSREVLGTASGTSALPARFPIEVVLDRNATSVEWRLTVQGPAGSLTGRVEGPGCQGFTGLTYGAGSTSYGGECSNLGPGTHAFEAVFDAPALEFAAEVSGIVTRTRTAG